MRYGACCRPQAKIQWIPLPSVQSSTDSPPAFTADRYQIPFIVSWHQAILPTTWAVQGRNLNKTALVVGGYRYQATETAVPRPSTRATNVESPTIVPLLPRQGPHPLLVDLEETRNRRHAIRKDLKGVVVYSVTSRCAVLPERRQPSQQLGINIWMYQCSGVSSEQGGYVFSVRDVINQLEEGQHCQVDRK